MTRVTMERKIYIEPCHLDGKISEYLLKKIQQEVLNKCDQEHGYVIKIYDNISIISNTISSSGPGVFFLVKFGAKVLKPETGQEYEGRVCLVFQAGIFVEVFGKMKVLIPTDQMGGYKYDKDSSDYKKGNKKICQDDEVKIRISMIKYEKQNFSCIGSLVK